VWRGGGGRDGEGKGVNKCRASIPARIRIDSRPVSESRGSWLMMLDPSYAMQVYVRLSLETHSTPTSVSPTYFGSYPSSRRRSVAMQCRGRRPTSRSDPVVSPCRPQDF
jgi:hypothetical protein